MDTRLCYIRKNALGRQVKFRKFHQKVPPSGIAYVEEGRLVKIEPQPASIRTEGTMCAKGQGGGERSFGAVLEDVFHTAHAGDRSELVRL